MRHGDRRPIGIGTLQETNLDITCIAWRRNEFPGDMAIIPVVGIHITNRLTIQDKLIERRLGEIQVIGIVAAPGVSILTAIRHNHVERGPIIFVCNPTSIAAERLVLRTIIDTCTIIANVYLDPASAIETIVEQPNLACILRRDWS